MRKKRTEINSGLRKERKNLNFESYHKDILAIFAKIRCRKKYSVFPIINLFESNLLTFDGKKSDNGEKTGAHVCSLGEENQLENYEQNKECHQ